MFRFPFGTVQELNLDWFLEQWEIFKVQAREAFEGIDNALDDEIDRVEDAMTDLYAARDAAIAAKNAAETAESSTLSYAQSAANSAASAAGSATGSAQSASSSAGSAEQAAQSAQTSAQQASSAATSAGNAATSATNASSSAATAANNATIATNYSQESAAWATGSYTGDPSQYPVPSTAPQHENNAKYYADAAADSATAAAGSATAAAGSATAAAGSATDAAASAASVSASAAQIAQNASDISDLNTAIELNNTAEKSLMLANNVIDYSAVTQSRRIKVADGTDTSGTNQAITGYINIKEGQMVYSPSFLDSDTYGGAFYDANKTFISGSGFSGKYYPYINTNNVVTQSAINKKTAPKDACYVRLTFPIDELTSGSETAKAYIVSPSTMSPHTFRKKVLVLGDSIEYGTWTNANTGNSSDTARHVYGYIYKLQNMLGWELDNQSIRGIGYVASGNYGSISDALTNIAALTDDSFDIIIIALGVNDYNTSTVTISDIKTSCANVLSTLGTKFKHARIVVFSPFNCSSSGDASTNYGYNYPRWDRSLKDVCDAIAECCDAVGAEYHNVATRFVLNNYNISTLLGDGIHPTQAGHTVIARGLAHMLE